MAESTGRPLCGECACFYTEDDYDETLDGGYAVCGFADMCGRTDQRVNGDEEACARFVPKDV